MPQHPDDNAHPLANDPLGSDLPDDRAPTIAYVPGETARPLETFVTGTSAGAPVPTVGTEFGSYRILDEIGRGGVGVVFRAEQTRPARTVALKVLHAGNRADELDVRRLHAEADAAAALDHPAIVPVFEVGETDGCHFLAMAYVEGETLADRLQRGPLGSREAADLLHTIAEGVAFAHAAGIVHRDLKPSNILLDQRGTPRVTDFGLAKRFQADGQLTATGQVMGTPSYMAPEQATGRTSEVGPAVDVYALGGVLYAMLTGRPPFQAATLTETLIQVAQHEPVPPRTLNPSIDRDLETICLKCLEKSPQRRYASADEVVAELGRYLGGRPLRARRVGPIGRAVRWCRRNALAASLLVGVAVSLVAGTAVSIHFALEAEAKSREIERLSRELLSMAVEVRETEGAEPVDVEAVATGNDVQPMLNVFEGEPERFPISDTSTDETPKSAPADVEKTVSKADRVVSSRAGRLYSRGAVDPQQVELRMQYQSKVDQLRQLAPNLAGEFDRVVDGEKAPPAVVGD